MLSMTLREKIGQMIMTGFPACKITAELLELISEYKISNIILFSHNLENEQQIYELCKTLDETIREHINTPSFLSIDQEGGVVRRLPKEMNNIPGAMLIGATGDKENAYRAGKITGEELKALGINVDLAPVLDVNSNPDNPVIGVRSYSSNPDMVAGFGISMMKGLQSAGVMP
ncbi:MAG TPA: glycoside hydrolase family 3, partial [Lachnospiraceae bacterium]|nr:glycoside hydrolase family 3 [Lachnospiraceae bacterium]